MFVFTRHCSRSFWLRRWPTIICSPPADMVWQNLGHMYAPSSSSTPVWGPVIEGWFGGSSRNFLGHWWIQSDTEQCLAERLWHSEMLWLKRTLQKINSGVCRERLAPCRTAKVPPNPIPAEAAGRNTVQRIQTKRKEDFQVNWPHKSRPQRSELLIGRGIKKDQS